jgi:hypothetical protein
VLEAAAAAGAPRVLLASSIHAAGFETAGSLVGAPVRPDSFYGVSKLAMEAMGSLYADRFDLAVVSARICSFLLEPDSPRAAATWLSPGDMTRLVEAAARLGSPGHHVVWGVSANAAGWFDLEPGRRIGFEPADDAAQVLRDRLGADVPSADPAEVLAGPFADRTHPLGEPW